MHLTLELDKHLVNRLNEAAQNAGLPPTEWIKQLIENHTTPIWPTRVKTLVGTWRDEPWSQDLQTPLGQDAPREPF